MWKYMDSVHISTAIVEYDRRWEMGFHQHERIEISAVLEGEGRFEYGDTVIPLEAGDVVLIPPDLRHRFWSTGPIRFAILHVGHLNKECKELLQALTSSDSPKLFHLTTLDMEMYESMFRNWLRVISGPLKEREKYVATWIRLFLLMLLQYSETRSKPLSVSNAAEYIRSHLKSTLHIYELAKLSGLSESSFRRVFQSTYGISPKQYQQECRLSEAKWLLRSTNKSIQLISEGVGFLSIHAFSSWFQKIEGVSPGEWRKQQQGEARDLDQASVFIK